MVLSQPAWTIYQEQMGPFHCGDALWEPAPNHNYERVKLGDVGHIRRGRFHLLFSAGCPLGSRRLGYDVPESFEPLDVGPVILGEPRPPGCLSTSTVEESGVDVGAPVSATPTVEPGVSLSFEFTKKQGAALVTRCRTFRADADHEAAFEEYTKRHYNSWVTFARNKRYGNDIKPVIVSGVDMTRDFAMMAYSSDSTRLSSKFTVLLPLLPTASGSAWGKWETRGLVHTNCGPQLRTLPPLPDAHGSESSNTNIEEIPKQFNQCVFIRYYTMRWKAFMFPRVIKAGAGPHDFGSGNNHNETLPELTMQMNSDSDTGFEGGEDFVTDHFISVTSHDPELELFHNIPSEERDIFDVIAEYVFQNSEAEAILVHHRDIAQIQDGSFRAEISEILAERQPAIELDDNRVGRLVHRTQQQLTPPSLLDGTSEQYVVHHRPPQGETLRPSTESIYHHFMENITGYVSNPQDVRQKLPSGSRIPQRNYRPKTPLPDTMVPQIILFTMADELWFPAQFALQEMYHCLVGGDDIAFTEKIQTIHLRIEWPGYDGWAAQMRTVTWHKEPKGITRSKLAIQIAKQVQKFIEEKKSTTIDPTYEMYKVGPRGIEIDRIGIHSLEQVSRGSWQPHLIYNGP